MTLRDRLELQAHDDVADFNRRVPVGTLVGYWKATKTGPPSSTGRTRGPAFVVMGHLAVVQIEGCSGYMAISHVERVEPMPEAA